MLYNDLELLTPVLLERAKAALMQMRTDNDLKAKGVTDIAVVETHRELVVQMAYYSRSRMQPADVQAMYRAAGLSPISEAETKKAITWTLSSKHLRGEAFDIVPVKDALAWWTAPEAVWERIGEIGEAQGLSWGGRWEGKRDCPHFEI